MTSFLIHSMINFSIDTYNDLISNITTVFNKYINTVVTPETTKTYTEGVSTVYNNLSHIFHFDEFQIKLLKLFLLILFINLIVIFIFWKIYGKRICEQFMKPGNYEFITHHQFNN